MLLVADRRQEGIDHAMPQSRREVLRRRAGGLIGLCRPRPGGERGHSLDDRAYRRAGRAGEGARGIADPGDDLLRSRCVDDIFGRTQRRSDRCLVDCSVGLRGDRDKLAQ